MDCTAKASRSSRGFQEYGRIPVDPFISWSEESGKGQHPFPPSAMSLVIVIPTAPRRGDAGQSTRIWLFVKGTFRGPRTKRWSLHNPHHDRRHLDRRNRIAPRQSNTIDKLRRGTAWEAAGARAVRRTLQGTAERVVEAWRLGALADWQSLLPAVRVRCAHGSSERQRAGLYSSPTKNAGYAWVLLTRSMVRVETIGSLRYLL